MGWSPIGVLAVKLAPQEWKETPEDRISHAA